jgi:hypothetical protein
MIRSPIVDPFFPAAPPDRFFALTIQGEQENRESLVIEVVDSAIKPSAGAPGLKYAKCVYLDGVIFY